MNIRLIKPVIKAILLEALKAKTLLTWDDKEKNTKAVDSLNDI